MSLLRLPIYGLLLGLVACRPAETHMNALLPIEQRVDLLMKQMTLSEKIGQMEMVAVWDEGRVVESGMLHDPGVGAWIGDVHPERHNKLQQYAEQSRLKIPYLIGMDAAHGHAMVVGKSVFPTSITIASSFDPDLVERVAERSAHEIRSSGNHWTFAPSIDVAQDARWGRIGETYGECPWLSARLVEAAVRGLQGGLDSTRNVMACAKHLIGGGASQGGINHASATITPQMLRTVFLPPFKAAVDAGVMTIMPGHNDVNGIPSHTNHQLMTEWIKEGWSWPGFYITDMLDIENLVQGKLHHTATDQLDAVEQSINAGVDMHMYSWNRALFISPLTELVRQGRVSVERIDDAVRRILTTKFQLGLFEAPLIDPAAEVVADESSRALALEAARESIVLLQNKSGILPLDTKKYRRILVAGPNANNDALLGDWTAKHPEDHYVTLLQGIEKELDAQIIYAPSGRIRTTQGSTQLLATTDPTIQGRQPELGEPINDYSIARSAQLARQADVAIVAVGGYGLRYLWGSRTYGESCDRASIDFYGRQVELVQAIAQQGIPIVLVYFNGTPLNNEELTARADAIIEAWEPGMMGGEAVGEVISGAVNPSGRLPITIPKSAGQIPAHYYKSRSITYTGYAYGFSSQEAEPAFCFGHGLSYTTFYAHDLNPQDTLLVEHTALKVRLSLKNTGRRAGKQTVMLFLSDQVASIAGPSQLMVGFQKVALEAGQDKEVELEIPFDCFKIWNAKMEHVAERGAFELRVGFSANDIQYAKTIYY